MLNWQKLQNEISEIDADDINKLADAIIDNQKDIEELKKSGGSVDLSNYYTKDETYDKKYIDDVLVSVGGNSFDLMTQEEFSNLQNNDAPYEEYEGKAIEALSMAVYLGAINANASNIDTLREQIGDIDSALDEIIALQVAKGGDSE